MSTRKLGTAKRIIDSCYITATATLILAPILFEVLGIDSSQNFMSENRVLSKAPSLSKTKISDLPQALDSYFHDNFPFREEIIRRSNLVRSLRLKQPSDHVIVGEGDWLFYKGDDIFEDLMGKKSFSETGISNWLNKYGNKHDWLSPQGIGYLLVTIPNKSTVHKEKLPWWIKANIHETRLEQLTKTNSKFGKLNWLDLTSVISELKDSEKQTYWHNDTHWSGFSMQAGLYSIFQRSQIWIPDVDPDKLEQHVNITSNRSSGDLSSLIGLNRDWPRKDRFQLQFTAPETMYRGHSEVVNLDKYSSIPEDHHTYPIVVESESGHGTVVIFHDSFLRVAAPSTDFASNHPIALPFKRTILIWARPTLEDIQQVVTLESPNLVIEERVERLLYEGNMK